MKPWKRGDYCNLLFKISILLNWKTQFSLRLSSPPYKSCFILARRCRCSIKVCGWCPHISKILSCLMPQQCTQYILPSTSHFVHPAVNHTRKEERACWQPGVEVPPGQMELMKGARGRAGVQAQGRLPARPCAEAQGTRDRRLQRPLNEGRGEMLSLFPLFLPILTLEKYLWRQSGRQAGFAFCHAD